MNSISPNFSKLAYDGLEDKISVVENHYTYAIINSNQGKCTSLQGMFNLAKGNIIITMDGHSSHYHKEIRG